MLTMAGYITFIRWVEHEYSQRGPPLGSLSVQNSRMYGVCSPKAEVNDPFSLKKRPQERRGSNWSLLYYCPESIVLHPWLSSGLRTLISHLKSRRSRARHAWPETREGGSRKGGSTLDVVGVEDRSRSDSDEVDESEVQELFQEGDWRS
jgi:hypothetical protein